MHIDDIMKNLNIDLRKEFKVLQNQFSADILYIRASSKIKCSCYDELHKTGDANCKQCLGRGYMNVIEKVKAIIGPLNYTQEGLNITPIGQVPIDNEVFYFDYSITPKRGDIIVITKFNKEGLPIEAESVYQIQNPSPIRGDHGRVELNCVITKLRTDKFDSVNEMIKSLPKKAKIYLSRGKKYKCIAQKM